MIENLSTETLRDIRNNIDAIIREREKDWEVDSGLTFEENKTLHIKEWEANIEEFQKMLPAYIETTRQFLNNATWNGSQSNITFDVNKWKRIIKKLNGLQENAWFI